MAIPPGMTTWEASPSAQVGELDYHQLPVAGTPINGLTPIHGGIHCAATNQGGENSELDELQQFQVNHSLHTRADVALAVAARKAASERGKVA